MGRGAPDAGLAHSHRQAAGAGGQQGGGRRRGRGGRLSPAARSTSNKTRTGLPPGAASSTPVTAATRLQEQQALRVRGRGAGVSWARKHLSPVSLTCVVKFISARGPLPFPSPQPGTLPPGRLRWVLTAFQISTQVDLRQEASRPPPRVPLNMLPTLALSRPGICPPTCSVLYTAPRTTPTHSSQAPRDPEMFLGYRVQTEERGRSWVRRGGHSRAAVRGS